MAEWTGSEVMKLLLLRSKRVAFKDMGGVSSGLILRVCTRLIYMLTMLLA